MDEPHLDPTLHHPVQHLQERHHVTPTIVNIHILYRGMRSFQPRFLRHFGQEFLIFNLTVIQAIN